MEHLWLLELTALVIHVICRPYSHESCHPNSQTTYKNGFKKTRKIKDKFNNKPKI